MSGCTRLVCAVSLVHRSLVVALAFSYDPQLDIEGEARELARIAKNAT